MHTRVWSMGMELRHYSNYDISMGSYGRVTIVYPVPGQVTDVNWSSFYKQILCGHHMHCLSLTGE